MPRGIPNARAQETTQQRRRKRGSTVNSGTRLAVNEKLLDRENFQYRFINDDAGRIMHLTQNDDYELVRDPSKETKEDSTDLGSAISVVVGRDGNGNPQRAYLARKPREFYEEDQREKFADLDETMNGIRSGLPQGQEAGELRSKGYTPTGGININEGSKS